MQLVVDRVLGLVLAHGSTATGSLTCRVKPERPARPDKMRMTKMAYTCKACMNIPAVRLCADKVRCQPVVSEVTPYQPNAQINIIS